MTTRPELTDLYDRHQRQRYADAGGVRQGGPRPIKICGACQRPVVFVESTKTGKWYLADCARYTNRDAYYYVKASPHYKTCADTVATRRANEARYEIEKTTRAKGKDLLAIADEMRELDLTGDDWTAAFEARYAAVQAKYADQIAQLQAIIEEAN